MTRLARRCSTPWVRPVNSRRKKGITLAFETGQETATLLRRTLDDLKSPNIKVNFDPANMLLYDMGDPIQAVEILGPDIPERPCQRCKTAQGGRPVG